MDTSRKLPLTPTARSSLRSGNLFAIDGGDSYIYYGQIAADKSIGFFKHRSSALSSLDTITSSSLMSRFRVGYPSIERALRSGAWWYLGHFKLHEDLGEPDLQVQWPVGTLAVTVWRGSRRIKDTKIDDPEIQDLEIMAVYDAELHVPGRVEADFTGRPDSWSVGGPIWRERVQKERMAALNPEQPWSQLPGDWVFVERQN